MRKIGTLWVLLAVLLAGCGGGMQQPAPVLVQEKVEKPSPCKPGYQWVLLEQQCRSVCRGGETWDAEYNTCRCPPGKEFFKPVGACLTPQERAKAVVEIQKIADSCPPGTALAYNFGGQVVGCVSRCWTGEKWDEKERRCVSVCPSGQKMDFITQQCVSICGEGTWDAAQARCNCPPGMEWSQTFGCRRPMVRRE